MTIAQTESTARKPLRLWPGVAIVVFQWLARFVVPAIVPDAMIYGVLAAFFSAVALLLWWVFFSRAPWSERLGAIGLMAAAMFATSRVVDVSIATGAQRMLLPLLAIPGLCLALVVWAALSRRLTPGLRWTTMVAAIMVACGVTSLIRTGGFTSYFTNDLKWRCSKTHEERLVAQAADEPLPPATPPTPTTVAEPTPSTPAAKVESERRPAPSPIHEAVAAPDIHAPVEWPGFRGPNRDGAVRGVKIETDWTASPPVELWRRP